MSLEQIIDLTACPIEHALFRQRCKKALDNDGVLVLSGFLQTEALASIKAEGEASQQLAYFCQNKHSVHLTPPDAEFDEHHPRNRLVTSSKGCITDDQIAADSPLRALYDAPLFREFLCEVLGEQAMYQYADPLSSINLHYAREGEELGWHFDNSSFAITLLIQKPEQGGVFEYVKDVRNADQGDMNDEQVADILDGHVAGKPLAMEAGTLVLFRGRNAMHRVTPVKGNTTRMLVVLAYNSQPDIALSESARLTFYGRLG